MRPAARVSSGPMSRGSKGWSRDHPIRWPSLRRHRVAHAGVLRDLGAEQASGSLGTLRPPDTERYLAAASRGLRGLRAPALACGPPAPRPKPRWLAGARPGIRAWVAAPQTATAIQAGASPDLGGPDGCRLRPSELESDAQNAQVSARRRCGCSRAWSGGTPASAATMRLSREVRDRKSRPARSLI